MSNNTTKSRRRAYIGNLRPRSNLTSNLYNNLFIPNCLSVKNYPNGDGIAVAQPNISGKNRNNNVKSNSVYALVEFNDVDYAIQVLNGVQFDGRTLRVSKEKTNFDSGWGGGFGSSRWATGDGNGGGRSNNISRGDQNNKNRHSQSNNGGQSTEETIVKEIESTISSEINDSSDEVAAALACTAAMTLLSSVDAFGLGDEDEDANEVNVSSVNEAMSNNEMDFQSRCKLPMSDLLAEYGAQDVEWKKQQQKHQSNDEPQDNEKQMTFQQRCQMPLSNLMAEYGEQDADWKKDQTHGSAKHNNNSNTKPRSQQPAASRNDHKSNNNNNNNNNTKDNDNDNGMLAHYNKASIHLELVSFGYKYGAPSHSKKGFTFAHPLPPLDVRDLDRAPGHIAKFNGLSYLVKKACLNPSKGTTADNNVESNEKEDEEQSPTPKEQSPMRLRANEIADEIIKVLVESIDEGQHGPISPLTMTISIGSTYGRHRSVVLVEHLGLILRARLRRNDGRCFNVNDYLLGAEDDSTTADANNDGKNGGSGRGKNNGIVKQGVSVGTRHLHVEARHMDEEAFGEDLKREARKAEKIARRRQMEDSGGWGDNDGW